MFVNLHFPNARTLHNAPRVNPETRFVTNEGKWLMGKLLVKVAKDTHCRLCGRAVSMVRGRERLLWTKTVCAILNTLKALTQCHSPLRTACHMPDRVPSLYE